jgi:ADP-ribosylglycohydrolase
MERLRQALDGLSVGDAFGSQFFIPNVFETVFATRGLPPGPVWQYTDDTEMALCIGMVLRQHGRIDQDDLAWTFARRFKWDTYRGYGPSMFEVLPAILRGTPWRVAASGLFNGTGSMGNGGAMRVAPVGAYFADDLARVASAARASAEVTHFHPEGQAGAIAAAVAGAWAWRARAGNEPLRGDRLFEVVLDHTPHGATRAGIEEARLLPPQTPIETVVQVLGNGSRVTAPDTVPWTLWCAARHLDDYPAALWTTVAGAGDLDTTCAIVGGIVVMATGVETIPEKWLQMREPLRW